MILVHGIRTRAEWQGRIRQLLEDDKQTIVEAIGYGYFDVFRFLCPFWTRQKPIEIVLGRIRDALRLHRGNYTECVVIAHSFGTYIVGTILRENPDIEPNRVLLCGCILPATFRWDKLPNRPKVLNEAGSRDTWPILAQSFTWGFGATGVFGFQSPGVRDRFHDMAHSDYFKGDFARNYWVPWIRDSVEKATPYETGERPPTPFYKNLLALVPIKWAIVVLLLIALRPYLTGGFELINQSKKYRQAETPRQDYVFGTQFTSSGLNAAFPYGFVAIGKSGEKLIVQPHIDKSRLRFSANWDETVVSCDFQRSVIYVSITNLQFSLPEPPFASNIKNFRGSMRRVFGIRPMVVGKAYVFNPPELGLLPDQPAMWLGTLSDNQASTVFVVGWKIPSTNELTDRAEMLISK